MSRLLEPTENNVELASRVARGSSLMAAPLDIVVLSKAEYFARPAGSCTHPQGWPCFTTCLPDAPHPGGAL